jgi:hypothetical protein
MLTLLLLPIPTSAGNNEKEGKKNYSTISGSLNSDIRD